VFATQATVHADGTDKLSGCEYGENYTAHWVAEINEDTMTKVYCYACAVNMFRL